MTVKYLLYNGDDFGLLPNSLEVSLDLKEDERGGYSDIRLKYPYSLNEKKNAEITDRLPKFQKNGICSVIIENNGGFLLCVDYVVKTVNYGEILLTSQQYVDFQPIFKLGNQLSIDINK